MTLTMARMPLDSFLPSGALLDPNDHPAAFPGLVSSHQGSVISPLALPRNASQQLSYFDDRQSPAGRYSSASSSQAQQQLQQRQYLSPHRSPPPVGVSQLISPSLSPLAESGEHTASTQLRRVLIQNRRLLENWEAERAHLEANRSRAEEIYKEERAIMDEDRLIWAEKEAQYLARITDLERENALLRESVARNITSSPHAVHSPGQSERSGVKFRPLQDSMSPVATPGLGTGITMPDSRPFEPLDPRMQGSSTQNSTPGDGPVTKEDLPSIDVQEVHPDLEGIPLRPTAVKKSTFTIGKPPSPPLSASNVTGSNPNSNAGSPGSDSGSGSRAKATPAEVTQETLQAPAASRLIMHAGHTPNHSLSTFATALSTNATNTAGSSGTSTPTHEPSHAAVKTDATYTDGQQDPVAEDPQPILEPSEGDVELRGPLSLRNQQAFDEIFLGKVADKLLDSIQSDDATPTVLKHGVDDPSTLQILPAARVEEEESKKPEENEDVPLKFKSNSNFGAPLGALPGF
ncbi:hypothetical protein BJ166DRAFT_361910 [Pestalotiopsis sp. NC0098]|nr:hypothetical protein BJ166DRAFT_361910 [Pestalotiopsis sp. NC0098]